MLFWLCLWAFPALWFFLTELVTARPWRWSNLLFAAVSGALWPITIPLGLWVAFNPRRAESIRRKYGSRS